MSMVFYQEAKEKLIGKDGAFSGWVRSGTKWQNFDLKGNDNARTQSDS